MRKFNKDNSGIALITVVIGVMFCLLLTSTMLRVSLLGLQSREVNNQASDNFYDAESVIDTVRLNLQNYAAKAWAETTNGSDSVNFVKKTYKLLTGLDYPTSGSITPNNTVKAAIIAKLQANAITGGEILSIGNLEPVQGATGKLEGITIKDVEVKYEHPKTKMVSYVKTDITISAPLYASKKKYPLSSYSMFAGTGAAIYKKADDNIANANEAGYLEQEGCVYFGFIKSNNENDADAVLLDKTQTLILSGDNVVINGNVIIQGHSCLQITGKDVEIRGKIMIGNKSHLVIGDNTNLHCQDIRFYNSDNFYNYNKNKNDSDAFKASDMYGVNSGATYTSLAKRDANAGETSEDKYKYNGKYGLPFDWYNTSKSSNPYYSGTGSIVVVKVKPTRGAKGQEIADWAVDAIIQNGTVKLPDAHSLPDGTGANKNNLSREGHISIAMDSSGNIIDTELKPIPQTNKYKNSDGVIVTLGHYYDYFFLEMIDGEYFEKFLTMEFSKNGLADCRVTGDYVSDMNIKNGKYRWKQGDQYTKLDPGSGNVSSAAGSQGANRKIQYNNVAGNPTFNVQFTSVGTAVENPVNMSQHPFMLTDDDVIVNMDGVSAEYCGIVITAGAVKFKKDQGYCNGRSLLLLDTTAEKTHLKAFMNEVGSMMTSKANATESDYKYMIFNNLFNGGVARFCDTSGTSSGSGFVVDEAHNQDLNLVNTSNYEKK